jgi:hypothetical protein
MNEATCGVEQQKATKAQDMQDAINSLDLLNDRISGLNSLSLRAQSMNL